VARLFGIEDRPCHRLPDVHRWHDGFDVGEFDVSQLLPRSGQIVLLTGASGAGKSTLLRRIRRAARSRRWIDLQNIHPAAPTVIDCLCDRPLDEALSMLSRVGLAEAWSYLLSPDKLSDGQLWRLKLAMALSRFPHPASSSKLQDATVHSGSSTVTLLCDEFAAVLDRITACIVARCLRRIVSVTPGASAVVATSHDDLAGALAPQRVVECDFGRISLR